MVFLCAGFNRKGWERISQH